MKVDDFLSHKRDMLWYKPGPG